MHSVPLYGGPGVLPGQLIPNLPFSLTPQLQPASGPGFIPYHQAGPVSAPPMQLHWKHQAGLAIPHTNDPLQRYVDDTLQHRRGPEGRIGAEEVLRPETRGAVKPRDIAAVGRKALQLNP